VWANIYSLIKECSYKLSTNETKVIASGGKHSKINGTDDVVLEQE
jgi:hypothetical protein